jgi:glycosyltransferase involved in cell wall biosynthesis
MLADVAAPKSVVSVIVPARNEEDCLGRCLQSLVAQEGVEFELIVVDDHSTDHTREMAQSFQHVRVVDARPLPEGWIGKSNAVASGVMAARGEWLLFTDADTSHKSGSLSRALAEARDHGVEFLSYSPEQEVHSFWEKAAMPVIFAELAATYRPADVSDPNHRAAAANGQYMLVSRRAYEAVGGHAAVAGDILEDVALARKVKESGKPIRFRFGGEQVATRMYRSRAQLIEGWTKNLVRLFRAPVWLALVRLAEFLLVMGTAALLVCSLVRGELRLASVSAVSGVVLFALFLKRIRRAHFPPDATALAFLGLPLFSYLLLRSVILYRSGRVTWKGRTYPGTAASL